MTSYNSSDLDRTISADLDPDLHLALLTLSSVAVVGSLVGMVTKLAFRWVIPTAWKSCLWLTDLACLALSLGLLLVAFYIDLGQSIMCRGAGRWFGGKIRY